MLAAFLRPVIVVKIYTIFILVFRERELSLYAIARRSVVCLSVTFVHPTQPVEIFGGFFAVWYLGHPLTFTDNFTEIFVGNPAVGGFKRKRGSQIERFVTFRRLYLANGAR